MSVNGGTEKKTGKARTFGQTEINTSAAGKMTKDKVSEFFLGLTETHTVALGCVESFPARAPIRTRIRRFPWVDG